MSRRRAPSKAEIAWAAGLFEGEGSIVRPAPGKYLRLQLKMTDEDVVRRLHSVLGGSVSGPYVYEQADGFIRKAHWNWQVNGPRAHTAARLMAPWLGARRRQRLDELGLLGQQRLDLR